MRFAKLFVFTALTAAVTAQPQPRAIVLDNVRIVDGTGAAPIENGRIVLQGERIAAVGPRRRWRRRRMPSGSTSPARP